VIAVLAGANALLIVAGLTVGGERFDNRSVLAFEVTCFLAALVWGVVA
jgi:hypothetical protein